MIKGKFAGLVIIFSGFIVASTAFAQDFKLLGEYTCPGTKIILRFQAGGIVQVSPSESKYSVLGKGQYRLSGNRLTITFGQIDNSFTGNAGRDFRKLSGQTFVYTILDNNTFEGNGETWVHM